MEHWVEFPVLNSRFSLFSYFARGINSVYMSIPDSQFIPPSLSSFGVHTVVLCMYLYFGLANRFIKALLVCLSVVTRMLAPRGQGLLVPHHYTFRVQSSACVGHATGFSVYSAQWMNACSEERTSFWTMRHSSTDENILSVKKGNPLATMAL